MPAEQLYRETSEFCSGEHCWVCVMLHCNACTPLHAAWGTSRTSMGNLPRTLLGSRRGGGMAHMTGVPRWRNTGSLGKGRWEGEEGGLPSR